MAVAQEQPQGRARAAADLARRQAALRALCPGYDALQAAAMEKALEVADGAPHRDLVGWYVADDGMSALVIVDVRYRDGTRATYRVTAWAPSGGQDPPDVEVSTGTGDGTAIAYLTKMLAEARADLTEASARRRHH